MEKFQKGRWYKRLDWSSIGVNCILDSNTLNYTEYLSSNGNIVKSNGENKNDLDKYIDVTEEIQQYLPEGHPDRIIQEPVIGSYISIEDSQYKDYPVLMIGKVISTNVDSERTIIRGKADFISMIQEDLKKNKSWCYKDISRNWRLSTKKEIEWLNECIKQSKYIPKEKLDKPKFKVGDWCVCTKDYGTFWYKGKVWQIGSIDGDNCNATNGEGLKISMGNFRLATPDEIPVENLLEEAYKRYPIGTKYTTASCLSDKEIYTVEEQNFTFREKDNVVVAEFAKGWLFNGKNWAPIVSKEVHWKSRRIGGEQSLSLEDKKDTIETFYTFAKNALDKQLNPLLIPIRSRIKITQPIKTRIKLTIKKHNLL